jgi:hypothetical protein
MTNEQARGARSLPDPVDVFNQTLRSLCAEAHRLVAGKGGNVESAYVVANLRRFLRLRRISDENGQDFWIDAALAVESARGGVRTSRNGLHVYLPECEPGPQGKSGDPR